jgi:hypothetical protein
VKADLTKQAGLDLVCRQVNNADLLVNNAGAGTYGDITQTDLKKELSVIDLNIKAVYYLTKIYGRRMAKRGRGSIINISSTAAYSPIPRFGVYAATKAFISSFTLAAAAQLKDKNVQVMTVCPGPTDTEFWQVAGVAKANRPAKMMTAHEVVAQALLAWKKKKKIFIVGRGNRNQVRLAKVIPGRMLLKIISKIT